MARTRPLKWPEARRAALPKLCATCKRCGSLEYGTGREKIVDGHIGGKEREAVGQFKNVLVQAAAQAQAGDAECRFMDELQSQSRLHVFGPFSRPIAYQVPRPQPQQFGGEQPHAG